MANEYEFVASNFGLKNNLRNNDRGERKELIYGKSRAKSISCIYVVQEIFQ